MHKRVRYDNTGRLPALLSVGDQIQIHDSGGITFLARRAAQLTLYLFQVIQNGGWFPLTLPDDKCVQIEGMIHPTPRTGLVHLTRLGVFQKLGAETSRCDCQIFQPIA
ncbi:MAG: hypothetical protein R3B54_05305 [Bdellovibrionota bacterium]